MDVGSNRSEYSPGEFVYTVKPSSTCLTRPVDPFATVSTRQRALLHHFINNASRMTACHLAMQDNICKMVIPMALQTPSLLYAITALSAVHLQALNTTHSESVKSAPDIARYMALSLRHFREELGTSTPDKNLDALLATARTLCLAEIHSGAIYPNSWRAHVNGAKALISTLKSGTSSSQLSDDKFRWYLSRWYRGIVSLTALIGNRPPIKDTAGGLTDANPRESQTPDYLDDYWGFTVHLSDIFCRIGALAHEGCTKHEADALESSLCHLIDQGRDSPPVFYPGVAEGLSPGCIHDFILCNEAFQHSALIQIHRRLHKTPTSSSTVQESVRHILDCATRIGPSAGLSPWVMLSAPLFIAGCEAQGCERDIVRRLLSELYYTIRVPNVLLALEFLERFWAQAKEGEDWGWFVERMQLDFIPY